MTPLTPRRRAVASVVLLFPTGWFWIEVAAHNAYSLLDYYQHGFPYCGGSWQQFGNSCDAIGYSPTLAWVELFAVTLFAFAIAYALARWVVRPIAEIATIVARFGPNALGLRLRSHGSKEETRQLSDAVDAMLDRLAEGYEAQRRFASTASHELRTPLATQRALIEVSLSAALTDDQLELLRRQLLATNERNEKLVDGLLTLAETDRGLMTTTPLRLDRIVGEVVELHRSTAKERDLDLSAVLAPATVLGEEPLLERLVANLVSNAIKYNKPGGSVVVQVSQNCALCISNTGPTVAPELVPGLFEPFRRLSGERLDYHGGVGLGLTVARSIVAAHGGAITAHANPEGGGLTVDVELRQPV